MTMMPSTVGTVGRQGQQNPTGKDAFQQLELGDFIKLMVTELQHQDPMNPMDNTQILQQMSQMRAIAASDQLNETLQSVLPIGFHRRLIVPPLLSPVKESRSASVAQAYSLH